MAAGVTAPASATVYGDSTQESLALIRGRGDTAKILPDLSAGSLADLDVLWVLNGSQAKEPAQISTYASGIARFVMDGGTFAFHDQDPAGAAAVLPGAAGVSFTQAVTHDINVRLAGTLPPGALAAAEQRGPRAGGGVLLRPGSRARVLLGDPAQLLPELPFGQRGVGLCAEPRGVSRRRQRRPRFGAGAGEHDAAGRGAAGLGAHAGDGLSLSKQAYLPLGAQATLPKESGGKGRVRVRPGSGNGRCWRRA